MQVLLVDTKNGGFEELEHDCRIAIDLDPSKTITLDVADQITDSHEVIFKFVGGKPYARIQGDKLILGIRQ